MNNLIGNDILLARKRYDEALKLRGIPAKYQYPMRADQNAQGEAVIDNYSIEEDVNIFFESTPKARTLKRLGWVVENDKELPMLIHCSWNTQHLQKDSIFTFSGLYAGLPDRKFRVTEVGYLLEAPDHVTCTVVPVYDKNIVGRTDKEVSQTYNKSNTFLKNNKNYRGQVYETKEENKNINKD